MSERLGQPEQTARGALYPGTFPEGTPLARPLGPPPGGTTESELDHPMLLSSAGVGSALADTGAVAVIVAAVEVAFGSAARALTIPGDLGVEIPADSINRALFGVMIATRLCGVITAVGAVLWIRGQRSPSVGLVRAKWKADLGIGLAAAAAAFVLVVAWQITIWLFWPALLDQMGENARRIMRALPRPDSPLGFVAPTLAVAAYEELLFRGFLLTRLRRCIGGWTPAVIISTAVFTALHAVDQTPVALVPVAILSLVFSLVTIRRLSIVPAMTGHFVFDVCQLAGLYYMAGEGWS